MRIHVSSIPVQPPHVSAQAELSFLLSLRNCIEITLPYLSGCKQYITACNCCQVLYTVYFIKHCKSLNVLKKEAVAAAPLSPFVTHLVSNRHFSGNRFGTKDFSPLTLSWHNESRYLIIPTSLPVPFVQVIWRQAFPYPRRFKLRSTISSAIPFRSSQSLLICSGMSSRIPLLIHSITMPKHSHL